MPTIDLSGGNIQIYQCDNLIPIAFIVLPSSWAASNFLIAFAAGVPVTVLTWSGVAAVNVRFSIAAFVNVNFAPPRHWVWVAA